MTPASGGFFVVATLELKLLRLSTRGARSCLAAQAFGFWQAAGLQEPPNRQSKRASDAFDGREPQAFASHGPHGLVVPRSETRLFGEGLPTHGADFFSFGSHAEGVVAVISAKAHAKPWAVGWS